jgi:subtilisin family serine protease
MKEIKTVSEFKLLSLNGEVIRILPGSTILSPDYTTLEILSNANTPLPWWINHFEIPALWKQNLNGKHIKIAILDSGTRLKNGKKHPSLPVLPENETVLVPDFITPTDDTGHGIHIAGIIGTQAHLTLSQGIAFNATLLSAKVSNRFQSKQQSLIKGIEWATNKQADIITISRGYRHHHPENSTNLNFLHQAVINAYQNNILMVCAAGNKSQNESEVFYPAFFPETLSVGACDEQGNPLSSTINHQNTAVFAPGHHIHSLSNENPETTHSLSGSSQACAFVSGIAALLIQRLKEKNIPYTPLSLKERIIQTSHPNKVIHPQSLFNSI